MDRKKKPMTYSKAQLRKRFIRGMVIGVILGALVMLIGTEYTNTFETLKDRYGDLFGVESDEPESDAADRAEGLRDQVAQDQEEDSSEDQQNDEDIEEDGDQNDDADKEEKEEEPEEDDEDLETPEDDVPSTKHVYEDSRSGFSFQVPDEWTYEKGSGVVGLFPPGSSSADGGDVQSASDIFVKTREKETKQTLEEYYDGANAPNYYQDASSGTEDRSIDGYPGVMFGGVTGYAPTMITAVDLGGVIVEIHDPGQAHQSDGTYEGILSSFHKD